jgi:hypothetical protein
MHDSLGPPQHRRVNHFPLECEHTAFINRCGENASRPLNLLG